MKIGTQLRRSQPGNGAARLPNQNALKKSLAVMGNPIMGFALALIAIIWFAAMWQRLAERAADLNDVGDDAANMGRIIEQNVERTANNLDATLKFIRSSYERAGYSANWPSLISDAHSNSGVTAQIAVIDARGMMISSSAMPHPKEPVDLSDREHFKALQNGSDTLFVSRPVIGRASGTRTVQFARRLQDSHGGFAGVLVASLTTDYLTTAFGSVSLGEGSGIALYGMDGVIRAGAGIYAGSVGNVISDIAIADLPDLKRYLSPGVSISTRRLKAAATAPVAGFPLFVRVVQHDEQGENREQTRFVLYLIGAVVATVFILYFAATSILNRAKYEARIIQLAHFDALTGVPNRAHFKNALDHACASLNASDRFALILIDLDGFKNINDAHGHPIGDKVLQVVAERVKNTIRSYDTFARLGGDEFAIILGAIKRDEDAAAFAKRICGIIAAPLHVENYVLAIGASIGIALHGDGKDGPDLLKAADLALYEAKAAGRGTYRYFDKSIEAAFEGRRAIERDLKAGLTDEQFELYYQPIVDILSGRIAGYEALVRWHHPTKGFVPPNDFIPVAEETGLILPLGEWIMEKACSDIARCDPSLSIAVNCSPLQLKRVNFALKVTSILEQTGLHPGRLKLEITESIFMTKDSATMACLDALTALGVGLSLDDFGTGYSSLSYVMSYPFTTLKIDRSFTSRLCQDDRGASVVKAICALASSLDMETVAEGVETKPQLEMLRSLGCSSAQGYLFSKPKPAKEILDFVTSRESEAEITLVA